MKENILKDLEVSEIRKINDIAKTKKDCINLTIGEPFFNAPRRIKKEAIKNIRLNNTRYLPPRGNEGSINGVIDYVKNTFDLDYSNNEILLTNGATGALTTVIKTLIDKDDEVIVLNPSYSAYKNIVKLNLGKVIELDTIEDNFTLNIDRLKSLITNKTKAVIINYPQNPTSTIIEDSKLLDLVILLKIYGIYLISDEVYNIFDFKEKLFSVGHFKKIYDKIVIINSFSKSHNLTGFRLGYILTNEHLASEFIKVNHLLNVCNTSFSQLTLKKINYCSSKKYKDYYKQNIDEAMKILDFNNIEYVKPDASFYLFINVKNQSRLIVDNLLNKGVACVPGVVFGNNYNEYVRISCCIKRKSFIKAIYIICKEIRGL